MDRTFKAIVLAGVHHWLDSRLEETVARPLVPIVNRPLIEHLLRWLKDGGIKSVSVCANSDTAVLQRSLGDGGAFGLRIDYYEDHMPRGPAGCARDAAQDSDFDDYLIADATILPCAIDFAELLAAHRRAAAAAMTVVAVSEPPAPSRKPAVEGRGPERAALTPCLAQGLPSRLTPVGIYLINRDVFKFVSPDGYQDIKESLIPRLYQDGRRVVTHLAGAAVPRITGADSCMAANAWMLERQLRQSSPQGFRRVGEALIHDTAHLADSARLLGPVLVGPTVLGAACRADDQAAISRSILWDYAVVERGCVLDRCILTYRARVSSHRPHFRTVYGPPPAGLARCLHRWLRGNPQSRCEMPSAGPCRANLPRVALASGASAAK